VKYAHGNIIANMDGDGSHRPEDLKKMIAAMKNADLVLGSRYVKGGKNCDVRYRRIITVVLKTINAFLMGLKIKDIQTGFFVVKREVLQSANIKEVLGYKMLFPIAYKAKQGNFRTKEVSITFTPRKSGNAHVAIFKISGIKEIYYELKMAIFLRFGLY
jgi:dolichol-phosphate mannosyltransferase